MLANARSRLCFRLSADDAAVIARATDVLDASDFQSLGRYETYTSLVANSETQPFASTTTRPLPEATSNIQDVRSLSREQYGVKREVIEAELRVLVDGNAVNSDGGDRVVGSRRRGPKRAATEGDQP